MVLDCTQRNYCVGWGIFRFSKLAKQFSMGWASRGSFIVSGMSLGCSLIGYKRWFVRRKKTAMLEGRAKQIAREDIEAERANNLKNLKNLEDRNKALKYKDTSLMYENQRDRSMVSSSFVDENDGWL